MIPRGKVTIKHLASEDDSDAVTYNLLKKDYDRTRKEMWKEIFGSVAKEEVHQRNICLQVHLAREIDQTKIESLAKKYHTIPVYERLYYPKIDEESLMIDEECDGDGDDVLVREDDVDDTRETRGKKRKEKRKHQDKRG